MAGLGQLSKLTTKGMSLESGFGGGGENSIKWDDVAAALATTQPEAYWYARVVFCRDNYHLKMLLEWLSNWVKAVITEKGIKPKAHTVEHMAQGIAVIALFGEVWRKPCTHRHCSYGKVVHGRDERKCPVCDGTMRVDQATDEKLSIGKFVMTAQSYQETWLQFERMVQGLFSDWREKLSAHLDWKLAEVAA
jgi:hypothetical protein